MGVTIYDIAKELDISAATVSRALNGRNDSLISEATRRRVAETAKKLGYRPNVLARALITGKTNNIGMYVMGTQERTGQHFARMLEAVETRARILGYRILVCGEIEGILGNGRVDGIVMLVEPDEDTYGNILNGTPHMFVWSALEPSLNCVSWSDASGAYRGTKHLTDLGHRKIVGLFSDFVDQDPPLPKVEGFRRAIAEAGAESIEYFGELSPDQFWNGYLQTKHLLEKHDDFTGVLARNDQVALGAMKALRQAGKSVPRDVSVVGYNDTVLAHCADPALTSVHTPIAEAGELAIEQLVKVIEGGAPEFPGMSLAVSITRRDSCAPPRK